MDIIIRNQDIKKLETTCFGLTLAIFRFHLEKAVRKICYTNCVTNLTSSFFKMKPEDGEC